VEMRKENPESILENSFIDIGRCFASDNDSRGLVLLFYKEVIVAWG